MQKIINFLRENDKGKPPWGYDFLYNLTESEYSKKYLKTVLQIVRNEKLEVRNNKLTFNSSLLNPNLFDKINWKELPNSFVIKCNHGCKWQYIITDKKSFLINERLFKIAKKQMTGWLEQNFCWWGGFELQYLNITSKIIIEKFLRDKKEIVKEIEVYCFNGKPKIIKYVHNDIPNKISMYDENLNNIDFKFLDKEILAEEAADDYINQTFDLSIKLSAPFIFVRVDWLVFNKKLYFNELTFTPNSGMVKFDKKWNKKFGCWLNLEGYKNGF